MMIQGVKVQKLTKICDERGMIMPMLRADSPEFQQFGEIYFSVSYPGIIKGWHLHKSMTLNYACVRGMIKLVLYDEREDSPSFGVIQEIFLGDNNYVLVTVPPGVTNGFKNIGLTEVIVANCATLPHDPEEILRFDPLGDHVDYDWDVKHR